MDPGRPAAEPLWLTEQILKKQQEQQKSYAGPDHNSKCGY